MIQYYYRTDIKKHRIVGGNYKVEIILKVISSHVTYVVIASAILSASEEFELDLDIEKHLPNLQTDSLDKGWHRAPASVVQL